MVDLKLKIPEGFLDEETRCDHKVTQQIKEVWAIELDLLAEFRRVCDKYGLRFAAEAGTLLGAVRHKGYIPWDDDIDLIMLRDDYDKLCEVAPREFKHPYFWEDFHTAPTFPYGNAKLLNLDTTGYENPHIKHHGIFIDIFPYDNMIDDRTLLKQQESELLSLFKQIQRISFCNKAYYKESRTSFARRLARFYIYHKNRILGIKPGGQRQQRLFQQYEDTCRRYNDVDTKNVGALSVYQTNVKNVCTRADFDNLVELDFEFLTIPAFSSYHQRLTTMFGDYMKCVKGGSWHTFKIIDTDRPYTEVLPERGIAL